MIIIKLTSSFSAFVDKKARLRATSRVVRQPMLLEPLFYMFQSNYSGNTYETSSPAMMHQNMSTSSSHQNNVSFSTIQNPYSGHRYPYQDTRVIPIKPSYYYLWYSFLDAATELQLSRSGAKDTTRGKAGGKLYIVWTLFEQYSIFVANAAVPRSDCPDTPRQWRLWSQQCHIKEKLIADVFCTASDCCLQNGPSKILN